MVESGLVQVLLAPWVRRPLLLLFKLVYSLKLKLVQWRAFVSPGIHAPMGHGGIAAAREDASVLAIGSPNSTHYGRSPDWNGDHNIIL